MYSVGSLGIYDGYMLTVEPTTRDGWLWNDEAYYIDICLDQVETCLAAQDSSSMELTEVSNRVSIPPFIPSLRTLLRQYPDRFHLLVASEGNDHVVFVSRIGPSEGFVVLPSWISN